MRHDRGRVAADRHERSVADRDLTGVSGEHVQTEDRDEVDGDARGKSAVVVAEGERQQCEEDRDDCDGEESGCASPHTLRTARWPNSPVGLMSRMMRSVAKATGSCSTEPTKLQYWPTRLRKMPSAIPPTSAPPGLSRPPSTAAANAYSSTGCISVGWRTYSAGSVMRPATAPSTAARPQPIASSAFVRTPTRRAAAGRSAPARIPRPSFVKRKKAHRRSTVTNVIAIVPTSWRAIVTLPR